MLSHGAPHCPFLPLHLQFSYFNCVCVVHVCVLLVCVCEPACLYGGRGRHQLSPSLTLQLMFCNLIYRIYLFCVCEYVSVCMDEHI